MNTGDLLITTNEKYLYSNDFTGKLAQHPIPCGTHLIFLETCNNKFTNIDLIKNFWYKVVSNYGIVITDKTNLKQILT